MEKHKIISKNENNLVVTCPKFLEKEKAKLPKSSYKREYENVWTSVNAGIFDIDAISASFREMPDNPFKRLK